jgi:hypothetical protein
VPRVVDWGDWSAFEGGVGRPLHEAERARARAYFDALMAARAERTQALVTLLDRNGVAIAADRAGLQALNDWYRVHVAADERDPGRLSDRWHAISLDVGLYLGDAIIARAPGLRWSFQTSPRSSISFQRPVIAGFTGVPNRGYNVDPDLVVTTYGERVVVGDSTSPTLFADVVERSVDDA